MQKNIVGLYAIADIANNLNPVRVHDHCVTVLKNGEINHHLQLERWTRNKYDARINEFLLDIFRKLGLNRQKDFVLGSCDFELGRSFISKEGSIRFEAPLVNKLFSEPEKSRLFLFDSFKNAFCVNHELSHIFSCLPFYGNFNENSLLIHYDGGASLSNLSVWIFKNGKLRLLEYDYDMRWLTELFNANALVFALMNGNWKNHNGVPGKLMGYAAYGKHDSKISKWLSQNNYFKNIWKSKKSLFNSLSELLGQIITEIDLEKPIFQDIAATIHHTFLSYSAKRILELQQKTKTDYLYMAGGVGLSIKLNSKLTDSGVFQDIYIPPCTNDSGLSIGAASAVNYFSGEDIKLHSPYLNSYGIEDKKLFQYTMEDIKVAAAMLANKKVLGVCNGYGEAGPRALGNRSLLCRADDVALAEKVSRKIKGREWFRPVAPVMLEENAKYFTGLSRFNSLPQYMLMDFAILKNKQKELEGCVHVDGTARIQIISNKKQNPYLYDLLKYMHNEYNVKALVNTSFNYMGEPIVHTYDDAYKSAKKMMLDGLVYQGKLVDVG